MDLIVQAGRYQSPNDGEVEIVEREGRGHFDTICDALADEVSRTLCRASLDRFGEILHHIGNRSGHQRDGCWRSHIQFTIRCAIISRFVAEIALAVSTKHRTREFDVSVNAAHDLEKGEFFLTVIGTSAECGDDGRGNPGSGLIIPFRPGVD